MVLAQCGDLEFSEDLALGGVTTAGCCNFCRPRHHKGGRFEVATGQGELPTKAPPRAFPQSEFPGLLQQRLRFIEAALPRQTGHHRISATRGGREVSGGKGLLVRRLSKGHPPGDLTGVHQGQREPDGAIVCNAGHARTPRQRDELFPTRTRLVQAAQVRQSDVSAVQPPDQGVGTTRGSGSLDRGVRTFESRRGAVVPVLQLGLGDQSPRPFLASGPRRRTRRRDGSPPLSQGGPARRTRRFPERSRPGLPPGGPWSARACRPLAGCACTSPRGPAAASPPGPAAP